MLTLFEHPLSAYAMKVKMALLEKKLEFKAMTPDGMANGTAGGAFVDANPRAEVPTLIDDDVKVFDSTVILEYLEDKWPAPVLLPKTPADFDASLANLKKAITRAAGLGSPHVRCLAASDREHLPPGTPEQHIETMIKLLRAARTFAMDSGVKLAVENHKDFHAWETRMFIEGAGKEFVGSYLDTGNPVFVLENPLTTLEVLGPLAVTVHLRDTAIYEHPRGCAVQWVPLGEGAVDFARFIARMREICPPTNVFIKPITGRPPQVIPYLEPTFWETWPKAKAPDFAQFVALAKSGRPYEGHVVIEDIPGRTPPPTLSKGTKRRRRPPWHRSPAGRA